GTGQRLITGGATVVDVAPPELRRRGAAQRRAETLASLTPQNHLKLEVARRGAVERSKLTAMGIPVPEHLPESLLVYDRWYVDQATLSEWTSKLDRAVTTQYEQDPTAGGITEQAAVHQLRLPDAGLLPLVVKQAELTQTSGRIADPNLKPSLGTAEAAVAELEAWFINDPFRAPTADELTQLGLGDKELAAAADQQ